MWSITFLFSFVLCVHGLYDIKLLDDLWSDMSYNWDPWWETWPGMGACLKGQNLIYGIPDEACVRKKCLLTHKNEKVDVDKILFGSRKQGIVWGGNPEDCYPAKGGQVMKADGEPPLVSFIFTLHNHDATAAQAILEVFRTSSEIRSGEIIVIHDASTEPMTMTRRVIHTIMNVFGTSVTSVEHQISEGYTASNNEALKLATGTYAVLVNSDVLVLPGWISMLMKTMLTHNGRVGMVGPLQIAATKKVQESGGIIFQDASPHNMFRGEDVRKMPMFHARTVDYISAACVLFNRTQFLDYGLFDPQYIPAYFEDTDAGMTYAQHGYSTILQPLSVIIHAEGGTILSETKKLMMERNKKKFYQKHKNLLVKHCPMRPQLCPINLPVIQEHSMVTLSRQPNRVLYMDSIPPEPDKDAGSIRSREMLRIFQSEGFSVSFEPLGTGRHVKYALNMLAEGINYIPHGTLKELSEAATQQDPDFIPNCSWDLILTSRRAVFTENMGYIKHLCPKTPLIFDAVDSRFLKEQRDFDDSVERLKISSLDDFSKATALEKLVEDHNSQNSNIPELPLMKVADCTFVTTSLEKSIVKTLSPGIDVRVVSNIYNIPTKFEESDPNLRHGALFVGSMCYPQNLNTVQFIVQEVLGQHEYPLGFKMHIVLSKSRECKEHTRAAIKLAQKHPLVLVHLDISSNEMRKLHRKVKMVLAPAPNGAGVKGKVGHDHSIDFEPFNLVHYALLHGVPVISSSDAAVGMHLQDGKSFVLANSGREFESAISALYGNFTLWQQLRIGGLELMKQWYSREVATTSLAETIRDLKVKKHKHTDWMCPYHNTTGCFQTINSKDRIVLLDDVNKKGTRGTLTFKDPSLKSPSMTREY